MSCHAAKHGPQQISGGDFTAKDFRTWRATLLAAVGTAVSRAAESDHARSRAVPHSSTRSRHSSRGVPTKPLDVAQMTPEKAVVLRSTVKYALRRRVIWNP